MIVKPHVFIFTETNLTEGIENSELGLQNYNIYRKDRSSETSHKSDGGGVLIAVHHSITSRLIPIQETRIEQVFVRISFGNRKVILGSVYIPPYASANEYLWHANTLTYLNDKYHNVKMAIFGDFNLRKVQWLNNSPMEIKSLNNISQNEENLATFFNNHISIFNFKQFFPIHPLKGYSLDLLLSNLNDVHIESKECPDKLLIPDSHHLYIESLITFNNFNIDHACTNHLNHLHLNNINSTNINTTLYNSNFSLANFDNINHSLSNIDWDIELGNSDLDFMIDKFYALIHSCISSNVPIKSNFVHRFPPWFSNELKSQTLHKINQHLTWKITGVYSYYISFKHARAICIKLSRSCYSHHIKKVQSNCKKDPKNFYKFINESKAPQMIPPNLKYLNRTSENYPQATEILADYFSSVYTNFNHLYTPNIPTCNSINLPFLITSDDILQEISQLKSTCSPGPDGLPSTLIKKCSHNLVTPLLKLFNHSLETHTYPNIWKQSFVTPIYKNKGDRESVENYRPISIISSFAKVFDSIFTKKFYLYINPLISPFQHGFVKSLSVTTNLTIFSNFVAENLENGTQVDTIYLDFQKAFDKVCHMLLIEKLLVMNVDTSLVLWILSYISSRTFAVRIKDYFSDFKSMSSGVPQGSNLGPILFLLFINDLPSYINNASILILADDCKLYFPINKPSDSFLLQSDLNNFALWSSENHLPLQLNKCEVVRYQRKRIPYPSEYYISGFRLNDLQTIRDLGIIFCSDLDFSKHIDSVTNKAMRKLGWMKRLTRSFTDIDVIKIIFNTYVKPSLTFSSSIWSPYEAVDTKRLESVNHMFLRYLAWKRGSPMSYRDHNYSPISTSENIHTIISTHKYFDSVLAFKISKKLISSEQINSSFNPTPRNLYTRSKRAFHTLFKKYNYAYFSTLPRLRRQWNSLPQNIRDLNDLQEFKNCSRRIYLSHYQPPSITE